MPVSERDTLPDVRRFTLARNSRTIAHGDRAPRYDETIADGLARHRPAREDSSEPLDTPAADWESQSLPGLAPPNTAPPGRLYEVAKRTGDMSAALTALFVLSPVLLVVALMIYAEDRGPVLFYQTRVGKNGRHFRFYKFRSMVPNAEAIKKELMARNEATGPIFKMKNDPRITRIGKWIRRYSVDELPQLFNVLKGDLSLIGPRPHLPSEVAHYQPGQERRMTVTPGLICLREVYGRSNLTFERWVELDLMYIDRRSLRTDLLILSRMIPAVLRGDGAF